MKTITAIGSQLVELETTRAKSPGHPIKLETTLSYVFSAGVLVTLAFAIIGISSLYLSHGSTDLLKGSTSFIHQQSFFSLVDSLFGGTNTARGALLFVTLGMVSLVLTALLVVAISCLHFALRRDVKYVVITLLVLSILLTSLALH